MKLIFETNKKNMIDEELIYELILSIQRMYNYKLDIITLIFSFLAIVISIIALFFNNQSFKQERFESKLFDMIKFHRNNVSDLEINEQLKGGKCFVGIFKEFQYAYKIINSECENFGRKICDYDLIVITYLSIFYGVGKNSNNMLKEVLSFYLAEKEVQIIIDTLTDNKKKNGECVSNRILNVFNKKRNKYHYTYFDGHQLRLGHYYRHLYAMISFIKQKEYNWFKKMFSPNKIKEEKKKYAKMVRTQLSTYEQALLFINSLSPLGKDWWENHYLMDYELLKSIPSNFFKNENINLKTIFPEKYLEESFLKKSDYNFINNEKNRYNSNK